MTVLCCCFLKRQTDKKRLAFMRRDSGVHASATLPGNRYFMLSLYKITWSFCFVGKFHFLPFAFERVLMKPTSKHVSIESIHRLILFQACLPLKTRLWTHISCDFCLCLLVPLWNRPDRCSSFPRSVSFSSCFRLHRSPVFSPTIVSIWDFSIRENATAITQNWTAASTVPWTRRQTPSDFKRLVWIPISWKTLTLNTEILLSNESKQTSTHVERLPCKLQLKSTQSLTLIINAYRLVKMCVFCKEINPGPYTEAELGEDRDAYAPGRRGEGVPESGSGWQKKEKRRRKKINTVVLSVRAHITNLTQVK